MPWRVDLSVQRLLLGITLLHCAASSASQEECSIRAQGNVCKWPHNSTIPEQAREQVLGQTPTHIFCSIEMEACCELHTCINNALLNTAQIIEGGIKIQLARV